MKCNRCGTDIEPNWRLCLNCGAPLDASADYEGIDFLALAQQIDDEELAEQPLNIIAKNGTAKDKYALAYRYKKGIGVRKNSIKYKQYLTLSAESGYAPAQTELADSFHFSGDYKKAFEWYETAAKQGFTDAECNLAFCYYDGKGVKRDHSEAAKWFEKAAQKDNCPSLGMIAQLYDRGDGVEQNTQKAIFWYEKAIAHEKLPYLKNSYIERYNQLTSNKK